MELQTEEEMLEDKLLKEVGTGTYVELQMENFITEEDVEHEDNDNVFLGIWNDL